MTKLHLIYGLHAVNALLKQNPKSVQEIIVQQSRKDVRIQNIIHLASQHRISIQEKSRDDLDQLAGNTQHQGVIAQCHDQKHYHESDLLPLISQLKAPPFLLILDGIQDPHNLGACLRSANAAGVNAVISSYDRSVGLTPVVRKVASGAAEVVPFVPVTNLVRTMRELQKQGIWLMGLTEEANTVLFEANLKGPIGIVLGAEGKGLRRLTKESCDVLLKIPMHGIVSSLNVSVATGVSLFEVVRQRGYCSKP